MVGWHWGFHGLEFQQALGYSTGSFAKETRALKTRRVVASHRKLMTIQSHHQSRSSYNYTRTQRQPFCGHLVFEANWKGEKTQ